MDRDVLEQRLRAAEQRVRLGFELIAEQRLEVFAQDAWDQNSATVRRLLQIFEAMQAQFLDDLETARVQLAAADQRMIA